MHAEHASKQQCAEPCHPLGRHTPVQEFHERHGMRACMVAPTKIIAGLGMSLGIQVGVQHCAAGRPPPPAAAPPFFQTI